MMTWQKTGDVCLVVALLAATTAARPAEAQIPTCGATANTLVAWQEGSDPRIALIARTTRQVTGCLQAVQVEAWVDGAGTASTSRGTYTAEVFKGVPLPRYGTWRAFSKHWLITVGLFWDFLGTSTTTADIVPPQAGNNPQADCYMMGGEWMDGRCQFLNCPIVIDTALDGIRLTSVERGVRFDVDADGIAEQTAWTRPDSDDAWLAMDRNGNGLIDDGRELFGNNTPAGIGDGIAAANGFEALTFTEGPEFGRSVADDRIDGRDSVYGRLLLWRDRNHNGLSEPDELQAVSESGLAAISTDYKTSRRTDRFGNEFRQRARVWWLDAGGRRIPDHAFDVWLRNDK
jgi:hypothetical protein